MTNFRFLLLILSLLNLQVYSQKKLNRFNKHGQRTGKWISYNDSAKTSKSIEGRYRNGNAKGTFYFYNMDGTFERKEVTRFKILKTSLYYADGKIQFKGNARIDNEKDKIHYYFFGKWTYYDTTGQILKYFITKKENKLERFTKTKTIKQTILLRMPSCCWIQRFSLITLNFLTVFQWQDLM